MARSLLIVLLTLCFCVIFAQPQWSWMKGGGSWVAPVFGTQGVSSPLNTPGERIQAASWADNAGNLWIFGGITTTGLMGDLWKFNISSNQWTWVKGPNVASQIGIYGTQGVAAPANNPGARQGASFWTDPLSGDFYLFGGYGTTGISPGSFYLNDVWKYNIATNQWTWLKGSNNANPAGSYGTMGVPSVLNNPKARRWAMGSVSPSGIFRVYGGDIDNCCGIAMLSDLWEYDPATNNWTWISGPTTNNQLATYGTIGVSSPLNVPGCRNSGTSFTDNSGNFYIFGGSRYTPSLNIGNANDLWKFDSSLAQWVWISGTSTVNSSAVYGTQGFPSTNNIPSARIWEGGSAGIKDNAGNIWIYGGQDIAGWRADLWRYEPTTNKWTWVRGSSVVNNNGIANTYLTPDPLNDPGCKYTHCTWKDNWGYLWLYGGMGLGPSNIGGNGTNDLWKLALCTSAPVANNTSTLNTNICSGNSATLSTAATCNWFSSPFASTTIATGNMFVTSPLSALTSPSVYTYFFESTASGCWVSDSRSSIDVTVNPLPAISVNSGSLCAGSTFTLIPSGASSYTFSSGSNTVAPSLTSTYAVAGTGSNGCISAPIIASVTVYSLPTVSASNGTLCAGQTYTIVPSGAIGYSISGGSFSVTPPVTTVYTLTGSSAQGCSSAPITCTVQVFALPIISVNNGTVCSGMSFSILPSGAANYSISGGSFVVNSTVSSTYTISGASTQGCLSSTMAICNLTVMPLPTITTNINSTVICEGSSVVLFASGAVSYTWSNGISNSVPFTALSSQVYTVNGSDANGCIASSSVSLTVDPCTSLPDNSQENRVLLYPNPCKQSFFLETPVKTQVLITNVLGQLIFSLQPQESKNEINCEHFAQGIYFVSVMLEGKQQCLKFIKE
jgi:hypothetical protein